MTASLPLVDGGTRSAAAAQAQAQIERARIVVDETTTSVERDVEDSWRNLEAARANLATTTAAQQDADKQLRVARLREHAGKAIELEILDALAVSATAHEAASRAVATYDSAVAALRHAANDPLTKGTP